MPGKWIQGVKAGISKRGTKGAFGKATASKISAEIKKGGKAEKRAVLARTFKRMAERKAARGASRRSGR